MRSIVVLAVLVLAVLAACTGQAAPTATPAVPTELPTLTPRPLDTPNAGSTAVPAPDDFGEPTAQVNESVATLEAEAGRLLNVPVPGTMSFPEVTPDVEATAGLTSSLIQLEYVQTGGAGNAMLSIILQPDGTLTRDGVVGTIPLSEVQAVLDALDKVRFFDVIGTFDGPNSPAGSYRFELSVETETQSRLLSASEAYTPPELQALFFAISQLGVEPFSFEQ